MLITSRRGLACTIVCRRDAFCICAITSDPFAFPYFAETWVVPIYYRHGSHVCNHMSFTIKVHAFPQKILQTSCARCESNDCWPCKAAIIVGSIAITGSTPFSLTLRKWGLKNLLWPVTGSKVGKRNTICVDFWSLLTLIFSYTYL